MKTHQISSSAPGGAPAYLSNGLIGLRIPQIPLPRGTALVNGFVCRSPEKGMEEIAESPYPLGADLQLNGVWLSERPDLALFRGQSYDFSCGELLSQFDFTACAATVKVKVVTFCSRTLPTLAVQEIALESDSTCKLVIQANIAPRGIDGRLLYRCMPARNEDGILLWESRGGLGTVGAAYATDFTGDGLEKRRRNDFGHEEDMMLTEYHVAVKPGMRCSMQQFASLVPGMMNPEPHWQAARLVRAGARWHGFNGLRQDNRAAWAELWKGRIKITGAGEAMQDAADAAFFYLHSSSHPAMPCSIAPFGLSRRKEYSGHVFWDTETFMLPILMLTDPASARSALTYRSRCVPMARHNAALNGQSGIQFPCQSGAFGNEVAPFYSGACGGTRELHFNIDVAFAFAQYAHATDDDLFIRQQAWPVLEGVSEWIASRVTKTARGYELRHVTGPDEGVDNIHNNAYTNMAAIVVLREAQAMAARMGLRPPALWKSIEQEMYLPVDPKTNVMLKHDSYEYKEGMCVPETMGGFFPFTYKHSPEVDKATARYHLDKAETYMGMPMFSALYGVWACREGERSLARRFFESGILTHVVPPFMQFNETAVNIAHLGVCGDATTTVFLTNPAGFLMSCLYGLTGIQLDGDDPHQWGKFPIVMPEGWEKIEIERVWIHGRPARLSAKHGDDHAKIEFKE